MKQKTRFKNKSYYPLRVDSYWNEFNVNNFVLQNEKITTKSFFFFLNATDKSSRSIL